MSDDNDADYEKKLSFDEVKRAFELPINENYDDVKPVATRLMYMNDSLSLRPTSYSPLPSIEQFSILKSFPENYNFSKNSESEFNCQFDEAYNPQLHRLRRVILLHHVKRFTRDANTPLPTLEAKVKKIFKEIDSSSLKLINYYSRKYIQSWLQLIPQKLATHVITPESKKKGRRSREEQEKLDSSRFQLVSVRAKERIVGIESIKKKHELVKKIFAEQQEAIKAELQFETDHPVVFYDIQPPPLEHVSSRHHNNKRPHTCPTKLCAFAHFQKKKLLELHNTYKNSGSTELLEYLIDTVRRHYQIYIFDPNNKPCTFKETIYGDLYNKRNNNYIESLWSSKTLKPIIMLDYETQPAKLKLLMEIQAAFCNSNDALYPAPKFPVKYSRFKTYQAPQIYKLLEQEFWSGINLNEYFFHPEHTVVVMYKNLVVGCGFATTFGYITYMCVHPEWRGVGIGKFILYYLIQNYPQMAITVHIPNKSSTMKLYQSFGFKTKHITDNFYQVFNPTLEKWHTSRACFMKLEN